MAIEPTAAKHRPHLIDTTLREGMQAPGVCFTADQSAEIALLLARVGVDMIECGHPSRSDDELRRVSSVSGLGQTAPVLAHARADERDIAAAARAGAQWVGIFLGVNETSRISRTPGLSVDDLLRKIELSVAFAVRLGLRVRYTIEDASRTPFDLLVRAYRVAVAAGASRICFADTVGVLEPQHVTQVLDQLRHTFPRVPLEAHFHDDRGLALANSLAAIDAGASWISASVNGLGERCGITDLAALMANLHFRGDRPIESDGSVLRDLYRRVAAYSRAPADARRPVVGRAAFQHTAQLHRRAIERDPAAYSWLSPQIFGRHTESVSDETPRQGSDWIVTAKAIPATELKKHRTGPGTRYVLVDERAISRVGQYCIARRIPAMDHYGPGHVDPHAHDCDSLFIVLGDGDGYAGLEVEVSLRNERFTVASPAAAFIPAGELHSYRVLRGSGTYLNHVLAGNYNDSLLEAVASSAAARATVDPEDEASTVDCRGEVGL